MTRRYRSASRDPSDWLTLFGLLILFGALCYVTGRLLGPVVRHEAPLTRLDIGLGLVTALSGIYLAVVWGKELRALGNLVLNILAIGFGLAWSALTILLVLQAVILHRGLDSTEFIVVGIEVVVLLALASSYLGLDLFLFPRAIFVLLPRLIPRRDDDERYSPALPSAAWPERRPTREMVAAPVPFEPESAMEEDAWEEELAPGKSFEVAVAKLLVLLGYQKVELTGGSGDLGVDIRCRDHLGSSVVVQCKDYPERKVGSKEVMHLIGAAFQHFRVDQAILITSGAFTAQAMELGRQNHVRLIDNDELSQIVTRLIQEGKIAHPVAGAE